MSEQTVTMTEYMNALSEVELAQDLARKLAWRILGVAEVQLEIGIPTSVVYDLLLDLADAFSDDTEISGMCLGMRYRFRNEDDYGFDLEADDIQFEKDEVTA